MTRQQILVFVNRHPTVVDGAARRGDREVSRNLGSDLFKANHAIELAIDPHSPARADDCASTRVANAQLQARKLPFDVVFVNDCAPVLNQVRIDHLEFSFCFGLEKVGERRDIFHATRRGAFRSVLAVIGSRLRILGRGHAVNGEEFVFLAGISAITDRDREIVLRDPIGSRAVRDKSFDDLLHEKVRHRVGGRECDVSCAFQQFVSFGRRRQRGAGWINAPAFGFFERAAQQSIVAALRRNDRSHAVSQRKADASFANLLDDFVAHLGMTRELIEQADNFLAGKWLGVLGKNGQR